MQWYDEEVVLRFRFSWVAVPRFDDEAVKLELRSEEEARERQGSAPTRLSVRR